MLDLVSKVITYLFVFIIYAFILNIIRMVRLDIKTMSRKKSLLSEAPAYLKLINLRHNLNFPIQESYALGEENTVGRSKKCTIPINDPFLSQTHGRIFEVDGSFYLEDCDSTNGTFLNGDAITDEATELFDGDKVTFGNLHFLFVMPSAQPGTGATT